MQGSNGDADSEDRLVDTEGKKRAGHKERDMETCTLPYAK